VSVGGGPGLGWVGLLAKGLIRLVGLLVEGLVGLLWIIGEYISCGPGGCCSGHILSRWLLWRGVLHRWLGLFGHLQHWGLVREHRIVLGYPPSSCSGGSDIIFWEWRLSWRGLNQWKWRRHIRVCGWK